MSLFSPPEPRRRSRSATLTILSLFVSLFSFATTASAADAFAPRPIVDLDGVWDFATDPENVGETQNWFAPDVALPTELPEGYEPKVPGKINVPGVWDNQGYGTSTGKVRHNFVGAGWYKRTVDVPKDWAGKRIYLKIGGISRYAKGWVNGKSFGPEILGFVGENERDVTDLLTPGETATIALRVDSKQRWDVDVTLGASSLNDYMLIVWGGVWGHVSLEARGETTIDETLIRSDYKTGDCKVELDVSNGAKNAANVRVDVIDRADGKTVASAEKSLADAANGEKFSATAEVSIPNVKLWTPDTPNLYRFEISLLDANGALLDARAVRTGVRELKAVGPEIYLNGKPIFLRGYGDDHIYPIEFSTPTDKEMFLDRLAIVKAYGFNHVRHHSVVMPREYYDACDEIGMLPTAEFPLGYPQQLPGSGDLWKQGVAPGTDPEIARAFLCELFEKVVKEYRNHPSIAWWVGGNELVMAGWDVWNKETDLRYRFKKIAKANDPDRMFIDCDGDWYNQLLTGEAVRADTMDLYSVLYDEWGSPISSRKFADARAFEKPSLSHESGNYCPFMRIDQFEMFDSFAKKDGTVVQSDFIPFWMTDGMKKMKELGFDKEAAAWSDASEKLYFLHHKYNVEGMRLNPAIVGYYWWLIQDYWTTSNGLVDYFFRPKPGIDPAAVRNINAETVVLQQGLPRTARSGDEVSFQTLVSHFGAEPITGSTKATLTLRSESGEREIVLKSDVATTCPLATTTQTAEFKFAVPELTEPAKGALKVEFTTADGKIYYNDWTCRFFPKETKPATTKPIYSNADLAAFPASWNVQAIPDADKLPVDAVYVVDDLDEQVAEALAAGASVVALGGLDVLPSITVQYQQTWWKSGDSATSNNCGTFAYSDNPIVKGLTDGGFCDVEWLDLVDKARKIELETAPARPEIALRALPSIVLVKDEALIFSTKVDAGTLVVSGLNHNDAKGRPENEAIIARTIDAAATSEPNCVWPKSFLIPERKLPEGTLLGYSRLVGTPEQGVWKSVRSDSARSAICRQTAKGNVLNWATQVVSANDVKGDSVSFVFLGATGFSGEPATDGFLFRFNGEELFKFDLPANQESTEWTAANGAKLAFEILRRDPQDSFGVFTLTVPRSAVKVGARQTLTVESLGSGSRRWFAINPESNFVDF